jgi:thiol-disulfide isomerase/thioredoxin
VKRFYILILILFLIVSISSCNRGKEAEIVFPTIGNIAPELTVKDLNGKTVSLSDYRGKVILLEFWATWCPPCVELIPVLEELYNKYKTKGFVILSIASEDEGEEAVKTFVKEIGLTYPVFIANGDTIRNYGISGIPISFLIDKDGRIVNKHVGYTPDIKQELLTEIKQLL